MKEIHVECLPDEALVKKLGYTKKKITHHSGKAKVFGKLKKSTNLIAMVDEDPNSPQSSYEKRLVLLNEEYGVKVYKDNLGNKIITLKVKLEDWLINACKISKIKLSTFGLPSNANDFHDVNTHKIPNLERLIDELLLKENPAMLRLKEKLK